MSELKPTSKPGLKERLKRFWLFIKAIGAVTLAWFAVIVIRIILLPFFLIGAAIMCLYFIIFGSKSTSEVLEMVAETLRRHAI